MATPNLGYANKFSTTLSSGIVASDTTIPMTSLPTPSEGYLVIEPDSSTAWEEIYYTSKTGSAVVCPSAAAGRGVGGSTAASHANGASVRMDSTAEMFSTLQDATGLTGLHRYGTDGTWFDYVASGCVWTADSAGSTRLASMTSGVVYINGRRHTVAAVTSRTFTASKDTYIDLLYSTVDNVATPVYTEANNNAASPALASNSIRIGIIITGASNIANSGSVNQGQETMVLPIASSIPYAVTDSLGNLICPRDPNRKTIGYKQLVSTYTNSVAADTQITGLSVPVIVPTGRKVKVTVFLPSLQVNAGAPHVGTMKLWDGAVAGTQIGSQAIYLPLNTNDLPQPPAEAVTTPSAGLHTYNVSLGVGSTNTKTITLSTTNPAFIKVELV